MLMELDHMKDRNINPFGLKESIYERIAEKQAFKRYARQYGRAIHKKLEQMARDLWPTQVNK